MKKRICRNCGDVESDEVFFDDPELCYPCDKGIRQERGDLMGLWLRLNNGIN